MTHRPPASPRRRSPGSAHGPASLRTVGTLAAVATLILSVITVSTLPGQENSASNRDAGTHAAQPTTSTSMRQGNAGAAGDTAAHAPDTRQQDGLGGAPHKVHKLADHPLLAGSQQGLSEAGCELPQWGDTPRAAEEFFTAAKECLDTAWEPVLRQHHLPFHPPTLHFPTGTSFRTACGTIEINDATAAYYCKDDLYVPYSGLQTDRYGQSPGIYLALFAHEYGHHVQELTGIMDAAWDRIYRSGRDSTQGTEMSRRKELQAQCFSGMFFTSHIGNNGSITQQMFSAAWTDQASRGDDNADTRNHGSNTHYADWWRSGARANALAECNTFAAAESEVS